MAGFDGHLKVAIVVGALFTAYTLPKLIAHGVLMTLEHRILYLVLAFGGVVVFGVLLDIDVWSSIPRRLFGKGILAVATVAPLYFLITEPARLYGIGSLAATILSIGSVSTEVIGAVTLLVLGLGIAKTIGFGLDELTDHRGLIHSKEFVIGCGLIAFLGLWQWGELPTLAAIPVAVAVTLGGIVHLSVDAVS
ncbi:metal-dependent hydrolase [Natrinema salaciae]|uniref:LexA-binding, inner membrane-associated putative hydrolase n=1 Tax=Natrinema salaciae TaxID=1186196 RepID=A0A1H9CSA6_9EURY|nr:metal-dependent hydrolase [Natrinema salaciae]SEQ04029.1 LexA-binding, inner membrane-associated putative hydrolase [Natrinema salaciae]